MSWILRPLIRRSIVRKGFIRARLKSSLKETAHTDNAAIRAAVEAANRARMEKQQGLQSGGGSGFMLSWALFGLGTLSGAAYGIYLGKQGLKQREVDNQQLKKDMHIELERIAARRKERGGVLFEKARQQGTEKPSITEADSLS